MNTNHQSLWNATLGAWVAVPENVRARGKRSRSAVCIAIGGIAVLAVGALSLSPAYGQSVSIDGGNGACNFDCSNTGGAGGTSASPDGSMGQSGIFGGGGGGGGVSLSTGAGGNGGKGGESPFSGVVGSSDGGSGGAVVHTTQWNNTSPLIGDGGQNGQGGIFVASTADDAVGSGGGGGGGGGFGLVLSGTGLASNVSHILGGQGGNGGRWAMVNDRSSGSGGGGAGGGGVLFLGDIGFTNTGSIQGGNGGSWGAVAGARGPGAGGGDGGMGVALTGGGSITNSGQLTGGAGGAGDDGVTCDCGNGGAGVVLTLGGAVLNTGGIQGGAGGALVAHPGFTSAPRTGGAGIVATGNVAITNAGHIGGGLSGNGLIRANAIDFSGGGNSLTLLAGHSFTGNVVSTSGTTNGGDTFALGGDVSPGTVFDVSSLVSGLPGAYATWTGADGFYADAVLQSGRHRYTVQPLGNPGASAGADSLSASIEAGKALALADGWQIEPQLQLAHQRTGFDAVEIAGAQVRQEPRSSWLLRAGVRVKGDLHTGAGRLRPHAILNLYRASGGQDSALFINPVASTTIASQRGASAAELALGFALDVGAHSSVHAGLGRMWALGGQAGVRSQLQASLGWRVRW